MAKIEYRLKKELKKIVERNKKNTKTTKTLDNDEKNNIEKFIKDVVSICNLPNKNYLYNKKTDSCVLARIFISYILYNNTKLRTSTIAYEYLKTTPRTIMRYINICNENKEMIKNIITEFSKLSKKVNEIVNNNKQ